MEKSKIPLNTLDKALHLSQVLSHDLTGKEGKVYRIFIALASDKIEALVAFAIWRARGEIINEIIC